MYVFFVTLEKASLHLPSRFRHFDFIEPAAFWRLMFCLQR